MSKICQKACKYLNCVENLLILALIVTGCVLIFGFASLVCFAAGITRSPVGINICAATARIEKHKSIRKKRRKVMIKQCCQKKISLILLRF